MQKDVIYMIDKIFADFNNTLCRELLMRERAQRYNLYRFRTKLDFIQSLSIRASEEILWHKKKVVWSYKLSGVRRVYAIFLIFQHISALVCL